MEGLPYSSSNALTDDMDANRELENIESGEELVDELSRKTKINWHWLYIITSWTAWGAGFILLTVFLWNYLAPDRLVWLDGEKISDLKFIIGVTSINAAGIYIQWLRSNKVK